MKSADEGAGALSCVRSCLLSAVAITGALPAQILAADAREQARALVHVAQHLEDAILDGAELHWRVERGRCRSVEDAMRGVFDRNHPIDSYECRWLTNDGTFLYESLAQQPRRVIERHQKQQTLLTSSGSEQFLATKRSRLRFDPEPFVKWQGVVENEENGLSPKWGPGATPVYGGAFGLGRVTNVLTRIANPENVVAIDEGASVAEIDSRVLRITEENGSEGVYYFDTTDFVLVQSDNSSKGQLSSRMIVTETRRLVGDGDREPVVIPTMSVMLSDPSADGSWVASRITVGEVKLGRVPLSEMVINADSPVLGLNPSGRLQKATAVTQFTAENLDDVVAKIFADRERADLDLKESLAKSAPLRDTYARTYTLVAINLVILVTAVWYFYSRRKRSN